VDTPAHAATSLLVTVVFNRREDARLFDFRLDMAEKETFNIKVYSIEL